MIARDILAALIGVGDAPLSPSDEQKLEFIEAGIVADVERATRRTFREPVEITEYRNGTGDQRMELRCPVTSGTPVVSVSYGGSFSSPLDSTFYSVRPHPVLHINSILWLDGGKWPFGEGNIRIVYTGGYEAEQEPGDIRYLVGRLTALAFRSTPVAVSASPQQENPNLPADLQAIVDRWAYYEGITAMRLVSGY